MLNFSTSFVTNLIPQASRDSEVARAMAAATKRDVRAPRKGATLEGGLWRSVIVDRTLVLVRRTFARVAGGKKRKCILQLVQFNDLPGSKPTQ